MVPDGLVDALLTEARFSGVDLARLGIAWGRVLPTALFVPAFGLGFLSLPVRSVIALGLAIAVAPSIPVSAASGGGAGGGGGEPWPLSVVEAILRGVPLAIAASVSLWSAMVAGGVADTAAGSGRFRPAEAALGPRVTPISTLCGLLASIAFFETGGASRVVERLSSSSGPGLQGAVQDLAAGIALGAGIGAPFLVAVAVVDVAISVATQDRPAVLPESVFAPLRALVVLIASAALFERVAEATVVFASKGP
jgi:flagellar biosynthesis protein FliR